MRIWRNLAVCFTLIGVSLTGLFLGCTRQISVLPTIPSNLSPTASFTVTNTLVPTGTATPTITLTPSGPTNTPTETGTATNTQTITATFTVTNTATPTSTPTVTNTPTPDYTLIDDFESAGAGDNSQIADIQDQNGKYRNGFWYDYASANTGDSQNISYTGAGYISTNALECSGTMGDASSSAGFGFGFSDPANATQSSGVSIYDATVGGIYTGISFYAKANSIAVTNCGNTQVVQLDFVDSANVDHLIPIPLTTSWQLYTIYFNQVLSSAGAALDPTQMYQLKWEPLCDGAALAGSSTYAYDFLIDTLHFVSSAAPAAATPTGSNVVDDFRNGTNQTEYSGAGSGYWFTYEDTLGTSICPTAGGSFFPSAPGDVGGPYPIAAHISGNETTSVIIAGVTNYPFCGTGFWMGASGSYATNISAYTQIVYHVKSSLSTSYLFALSDSNFTGTCGYNPYLYGTYGAPLTSNNTWKAVTITMASPGSSGCSTPAAPLETNIGQWQWQIQAAGSAYDLWVDDIYLQ